MLSMVGPYTMNRIPAKRLTIDEATWIGFVCWIILDDFSMQHREEDFVKRELISLCFFIRMIANAEPIGVNCLDYIVNVNVRLLLCTLEHLRPDICLRNLSIFVLTAILLSIHTTPQPYTYTTRWCFGSGKGRCNFCKLSRCRVKRFTGMLKGFGQGCPAGNDVWHIGKIDSVGWCLRLVRDGEDIAAILVCGRHRFRASKSLRMSSGWHVCGGDERRIRPLRVKSAHLLS